MSKNSYDNEKIWNVLLNSREEPIDLESTVWTSEESNGAAFLILIEYEGCIKKWLH